MILLKINKILTLLSVFVVLTGCSSPSSERSREDKLITKEKYIEAVENGTVKETYSDPWLKSKIKKGWYEGHEYLIYEKPKYKGGYGGLVHSPDCPCYLLKD